VRFGFSWLRRTIKLLSELLYWQFKLLVVLSVEIIDYCAETTRPLYLMFQQEGSFCSLEDERKKQNTKGQRDKRIKGREVLSFSRFPFSSFDPLTLRPFVLKKPG